MFDNLLHEVDPPGTFIEGLIINPDQSVLHLGPTEASRAPFAPSFNSATHESEAQFRELMAHLRQVFWIRNAADTATLYVSPAYEEIWGRSRASLYDGSHSFLDSIHPGDRPRVFEAMSATHENEGYEEEYRIIRPDGTVRWIWARSYPVRAANGDVQRYAGIAEDVSERKSAEKERARLAAIIELTEDSIVNITLEGVIIGWNGGAERKYGYTAEEIIGCSIACLIPLDQRESYFDMMKKVRRGEVVPEYDTVRRRKDGTLVNLSIGLAPIESREGEIVGVSKIGHDISRVKSLEAQLIEAQKMALVAQLASGITHDFNNILAIVLGYSELMMESLAAEDPMRTCAAAIRHATMRGTGLTRQLLVFNRKETIQPVFLDLNEVIRDVQKMLRRLIDENIIFTVNLDEQIGGIRSDRGYVEQVLMNLVTNGRDAMPRGGNLRITTSDVAYAYTQAGEVAGDYVMLSVSDTGCGMTEEVKSKLFEPFFTTKPRGAGTGLGLSTCKTIVDQAGGHIDVESELGKGTTFNIYFPRVARKAEAEFSPTVLSSPACGAETLLIVEDDFELRQLVCKVLRSQGYEVLAAADGEAALSIINNSQRNPIHLVMTDVVMPRMGGNQMVGQIKAICPTMKILFTSGYPDESINRGGNMGPGTAFLPKPYSISALAQKVRQLLNEPSLLQTG